jgi:uncharacterized protein YqfB (UPF0267 family)
MDNTTQRPWYTTGSHVQACNLETDGYVCKCDIEADAELIVKAVNNHSHLLNLSKDLTKAIEEAENDTCYSLNQGIHSIAIARAYRALKKLISKIGG